MRGFQPLLRRALGKIQIRPKHAAQPHVPQSASPAAKWQPMLSTPHFEAPPRPIFIIGAPRSGTSITNWCLGQHPNIQPMPETAWIAAMAVGVQRAYVKGSERGRFSHLSNVGLPPEPFYRRMGEAIHHVVCDVFDERCTRMYGDWRGLAEINSSREHPAHEMRLRRRGDDPKKRWIDATPLNSAFALSLSMLFPAAQFIHLVRQPNEVIASLANFDAAGGRSQAIAEAAQTWLDHTYAAHMARKALGSSRVLTARFDVLSVDPKGFFEEVLGFLGESWSDDCVAPLKNKINSSQVDRERTEISSRLSDDALYRRCVALYNDVTASAEVALPDPSAVFELRARFEQEADRLKPF